MHVDESNVCLRRVLQHGSNTDIDREDVVRLDLFRPFHTHMWCDGFCQRIYLDELNTEMLVVN